MQDHPFMTLFFGGSTGSGLVASVFFANGLSRSGYSRRLTQAEAHTPPAEFIPKAVPALPADVSLDVISSLPHTVCYSAAPPVVGSLHHASITPAPKYRPSPTANSDNLQQITSLSGALIAAVGAVALGGIVYNFLSKCQLEKESLSDTKLIAILQLALNNAEVREQDLNNRLKHYQSTDEAAQTSEKTLRAAMQLLQTNLDVALADRRIDQNLMEALKDRLGSTEEDFRTTEDELFDLLAKLQKVIQEKDVLQQTKIDLQRAIDVLKTQSITLRQQKDNLKNESKMLEQKISDLMIEIQSTESKDTDTLSQKDDEINGLTAKLEASRREIELATNNHQEEQQRCDDRIQYLEKCAQEEQERVEKLVDRLTKHVDDLRQRSKLDSATIKSLSQKLQGCEQTNQAKSDRISQLQREKEQILSTSEASERDLTHKITRLQQEISSLGDQLRVCQEADASKGILNAELQRDNSNLNTQLQASDESIKLKVNELLEVKKIKEKVETAHEATRQKHNAEVEKLKADYKDHISRAIESAREDEQKKALAVRDDLQLEHDVATAEAKQEADRTLTNLESDHKRVLQQASTANIHQKQHIEDLQEQNARLVEKQKTHVARIDDLGMKVENMESIMSDLRSEKMNAMDEVEGVQKLYDEAQSQIEALTLQLDGDKACSSKQQEEVKLKLKQSNSKAESLEHELGKLAGEHKDEVDALQGKIDAMTAQMASLRKAKEAASEELKQVKEQMKKDLAKAYELLNRQTTTTRELEQQQHEARSLLEIRDGELANDKQQIETLDKELKIRTGNEQELEEHLEKATQRLSKQGAEHAFELERIKCTNKEYLGQIQGLQQELASVKTELETSNTQVQQTRDQSDADLQDERRHIQDLQQTWEITTKEHMSLQHELDQLQTKHASELGLKDQKIEMQALSLQERNMQNENLNDHLKECSTKYEAEITKLQEQLEDEPTADTLATTSRPAEVSAEILDRVTVPNGLNWSNRMKKDAFAYVVRCGIVQQDLYRLKDLVQLSLPHSDPFYSDLPKPIPKPCNVSYNGDTHTCEHCRERYAEEDYHLHLPMCRLFFYRYAVVCTHCKLVFLDNKKFKDHEKQCGQARTSGIASEVFAQLPPTEEFDILVLSTSELPTPPTFQDSS
jgi:chromosome segregation ATPase